MRKIATWSVIASSAILLAGAAQAASLQTTTPANTVVSRETADTMMVVNHATAHLRKEPNTKSAIVATLKKGTKVDVIEKVAGGKWAHVKVDKDEGYVAIALLK